MNSELTIVIVAKDAATTIGRAIASARASGDWPILLVNDCSADETTETAKAIGGDRLAVHKTQQSVGIGNARQTALNHIATEYALWLDADDEILPHRPNAMLQALKEGADLCFDPAVLFDAASGADMQVLPIPDFIQQPGGILRSFERNWIPALTGGFRTKVAQSIGYDPTFKCAEDYDFLLRAIAAEAHIAYLPETGYRYAHSPSSTSRNIEMTQAACTAALAKHRIEDIRSRVENSELPKGDQRLILAHAANTRGHYEVWATAIASLGEVNEAVQPYNRTGKWLSAYLQATSALLTKEYEHAARLLAPLAGANSADVCNNLGVALWHLGDHAGAIFQWRQALMCMPQYRDAAENLRSAETIEPLHITQSPLRQAPSRTKY